MKENKLYDRTFGEEASFRCECGATILTTQDNELKKAAIHMQCRACNCYMKRVTKNFAPHAVSVGG